MGIVSKNKKQILAVVCSVAVTIAMIIAGGAYLGYRLDPPESEYSLDAIEAFHELPENSQDVIVYGSSHAWKDVDTRVMRERWGLAAYNYGCNWQAINTTQLFLEDSFATQSPKVVCIETYMVHNVLNDVDMDGQIYYTRKLPYSSAKMRYLRQCFGSDPERYASYYFPLIMFHDNWSTLDEDSFEESDPQHFIDTAGYNESDTVASWEAPDIWSFPQAELSDESTRILDEMIATCKDHGAKVILFTCPFSPFSHEHTIGFGDPIEQYAASRGVPYFDLFNYTEEMGFDWDTDLRDRGHLNDSGAGKVADFLGKYITENYDI